MGLSIRENGLGITNPFAGTFIPDDHNNVRREPIPAETLYSATLLLLDNSKSLIR